jgi:hypothetical protein
MLGSHPQGEDGEEPAKRMVGGLAGGHTTTTTTTTTTSGGPGSHNHHAMHLNLHIPGSTGTKSKRETKQAIITNAKNARTVV